MTQLNLAKAAKRHALVRPSLLALTACFAASAFAASPAHADGVDPAQVQALQQQIQALQAEIDGLVANQVKQSKKITAVTKGSPKIVFKAGKFSLASADGQNTIALTGRIHVDAGDYVSVKPASVKSGVQDLSSGLNIRRARIGVTGKLGGVWGYTFIYDAGNTPDSTSKGIQSAQVAYNGFKNTAIEFGYSDTFFTLDEATSSNDTLFMERSLPSDTVTAIAAGDFRANAGVRHWSDRYWAGAYLTGPTSTGTVNGTTSQFGAIERATYQVLQGPGYSVHLGGGVQELLKPGGSTFGTPSAAQTAATLSLSDTPELRVDSTKLLTTSSFGTLANPITGAQVYNVESAAEYHNFFYQGEFDHVAVGLRGAQQLSFNGGYGEVAYTITGESHPYKPDSGAYGSITPAHPFSLKNGGWGAWEVAARLSYMGLNDNLRSKAPASGAGGGDESDVTVGLNWYVNSNMRYMFDYVHGLEHGSNFVNAANGLTAKPGTDFDAIAVRAQVTF